MGSYDFHCHLDLMPSMMGFAKEMKEAGIGILAVTTTPKAYKKEITALRPFTNIKVALGLHPQLVSERCGELSLIEKYIGEAMDETEARILATKGVDEGKHVFVALHKGMDGFMSDELYRKY